MHGPRTAFFSCGKCESLYHVVRTRAGVDSLRADVRCCVCGAAFTSYDEDFVLKYFVVRRTDRPRRQRRT